MDDFKLRNKIFIKQIVSDLIRINISKYGEFASPSEFIHTCKRLYKWANDHTFFDDYDESFSYCILSYDDKRNLFRKLNQCNHTHLTFEEAVMMSLDDCFLIDIDKLKTLIP